MSADGLARFEDLVAAVALLPDAAGRQAAVDTFVHQQPVSPLVGANEAVIWYAGPGAAVVLRGDMLGERSAPLVRLADTTLWFHRARYETAARLDYHLLVDGVDVGDPRNPVTAPSGYGPRAELRMPGYAPVAAWRPRSAVARGAIEEHPGFASATYPSTRTLRIYLPPGSTPGARYPTLFFHDGGDYVRFAHAPALLDNLVADRLLPPVIGVFVDPSAEHGRVAEYDLNLDFARFVARELVPWVDARYATEPDPARRVVVGASFGGLIALTSALAFPEVFGAVVAQSAFAGRRGDRMIQQFAASEPRPLRIHLIVGSYETEVGSWQQPAEADFVRGNRALRDVLRTLRYSVAYAEFPEGHAWGLWREQLGPALRFALDL